MAITGQDPYSKCSTARDKDGKTKIKLLREARDKAEDAIPSYLVIGSFITGLAIGFGMISFVPKIRDFMIKQIGKSFGKFAIASFAVTAAASIASLGYAGYNKVKAKEFTAEIDKINNPQASLE